MTKKTITILIVMVAFVLGMSIIGYGFDLKTIKQIPGNIHIGNLKIHPYMDSSISYTDNIFTEPDSEKGSTIYRVKPGVLFQFPFMTHFIQVDYHADIQSADRFHKEYDTEDHYLSSVINLNFNRFNVVVTDNWQRASNAPDYQGDIRDQYYYNQVRTEVSYKLADRYKVTAFYMNEFKNYGNIKARPNAYDPELDNYWKNEYGFDLYYRILPLTSILLEYAYTDINNKDENLPDTDSENHRVWFGVKWEPTAKISGVIKGGYYRREYDGPSDDWDGFGLKANVIYNYSSFTKFSLQSFREPVDTTVTTAVLLPSGLRTQGDYGTYYISSGVTFSVEQTCPRFPGLSAKAYFSYTNDDYQEKGMFTEERDDDRFRYGIDISYKAARWIKASVGYSYMTNESNFDSEDYRENMFTASLTLTF